MSNFDDEGENDNSNGINSMLLSGRISGCGTVEWLRSLWGKYYMDFDYKMEKNTAIHIVGRVDDMR